MSPCIHLESPSPRLGHDDRSTPMADLLMACIHAFHIPVFLVLAGFFVTLLVQRRGPQTLVRNRLQRLALPFVVFWPPLYVFRGLPTLLFLPRTASGTRGIHQNLLRQGSSVPKGPSSIIHL